MLLAKLSSGWSLLSGKRQPSTQPRNQEHQRSERPHAPDDASDRNVSASQTATRIRFRWTQLDVSGLIAPPTSRGRPTQLSSTRGARTSRH